MTPKKLTQILEGAEALIEATYLSVMRILVKRIGHRLKKEKKKIVGGADKNAIETMMESGKLREDIEKELAKNTGVAQETIRDAFEEIGTSSVQIPEEEYVKVGLPKEASKSGMSPVVIRTMERNYEATNGTMRNLIKTTADSANRIFIEETDKALVAIQTNNMSLSQAFYHACENIQSHGITMVTYTKDGKTRYEKIEVAVLRALRTAYAQTSAQVVINRARELGQDLIKVSSHMGARTAKVNGKPYADHSSWQGKIYSLSGTDPDYPPFYETTGFGTGEGLAGYNCRHTISIAMKGYTREDEIDQEENKKEYDIEQKMRRMERGIRKVKERFTIWDEAHKEFPDDESITERYEAELMHLRALNEAYQNFCAEHNKRPLEERLYITSRGAWKT